ncbi:hypothetical protein ABQD95_13835 [Enterococcus avium]
MEEDITIEFVRNWIEKHHLTSKSYESVLTDTLTNNGHYYIDNPYLRDWIRENTKMFRNILPYELNENQQIVLDVLKKNANQGLDELIVGGITYMSDEEINAIELSQQEELFQVLQAFSQWALEQEEE